MQIEIHSEILDGDSRFRMKILKVFLHPPPPLERESILREVGLTIPKMILLSMEK
jgi:hypothetical protein